MKSNRPEVRVSHSEIVPFKQARKPIKSAKERTREEKSLSSYFIRGGGNDIA